MSVFIRRSSTGEKMITHERICDAVNRVAPDYPVKKISYFGSYACNVQTDSSDLDLLVEFTVPGVSLFVLSELKNKFEDELNIPVDIVHGPVPESSFIDIGHTVRVYGE
jgi:predicted nucleotidyltransferase